jgi:GWxTD domain-containing protein
MSRGALIVIGLSIVCGLAPRSEVFAQASQDELASWFRDGHRALSAGDLETAAERFRSVYDQNQAWSETRYGSVAYWLSQAYRRASEDSLADATLRAGVEAMKERESFDVRLADAYVAGTLSDPEEPGRVTPQILDQYINLLYNVDALLDDEERTILSRYVAQLTLVAPAGVMTDAFTGDTAGGPDAWSAKKGAGPLLVTWWRSQDPVPATRSNERLEEHLKRLGVALSAYADPGGPAGLDQRGEIYLRYGPPQQQIKVRFDDPVLTDIIYRPGAVVNLSDFPENEFWVFGHIDRAAWFLFVRDKSEWRIGETLDLIPRTLRTGFSAGDRGRIKAGMSIAVMQNIFRQLSPLHPDFAMRYAEVDNYAMRMPEFGPGRMANRTSRSLAGRPGAVSGETQTEQPSQFIQSMMVKSRSEDDASIATREKVAPRVFVEALSEQGLLEIGYRAVRYLEPDGSTRTVVHWSPEPGGLRPGRKERGVMESMNYPDSGSYLVTMTTVQKDAEYLDRVIHKDRFMITDLPNRAEAIPVQKTTLSGDTTLFHVAMQWDQYAMGASRTQRGPQLRVATAQLDSLSALNADPGQLEMSDLLPMTALLDVAPVDFVPTPYPFQVLTRELQLALSFEIYHLTFGPDDKTEYTVTFDVKRDAQRGGFLSLRREDAQGTSASFGATGTSRTDERMILIDLQAWEGSGELNITVTVKDEVSGQSTSREILFDLQ